MVLDRKIGAKSPIAGIEPGLEGAPVTIPGSNDGTVKSEMTGTPVKQAIVPPSVTPGLKGSDNAGHGVEARPKPAMPIEVVPPELPPSNKSLPEKGERITPNETVKRVDLPYREPNSSNNQETQNSGKVEPKPKYGNMQDVIDWLEERKAAIHLPTKEELEKERRRKRTAGIISAIADGASAISNLIFTTQYAPDMSTKGPTLTEKSRERYDRIKKERDADADRYFNYAMTLGKLKDAADDREYKRGRDALADKYRQAQEDRAAKAAEIREIILGHEAKVKEVEANNAPEYYKNKKDLVAEQINTEKSKQNKNNRWQPSTGRGGGSGKGRTGTPGQYTVSRLNPKTGKMEYKTGFKSESAARNYASTYGWTYNTTPTRRTTTGTNRYGTEETRESTTDVSTPKISTNVKWKKR